MDLSWAEKSSLGFITQHSDGIESYFKMISETFAISQTYARNLCSVLTSKGYVIIENRGGKKILKPSTATMRFLAGDDNVELVPMPRANPGYVYVVKCSATGMFKIGLSSKIEARIGTIKNANPFAELHKKYWVGDMSYVESMLHKRFADKRVNREWFTLDENDIALIEDLVKDYIATEDQ